MGRSHEYLFEDAKNLCIDPRVIIDLGCIKSNHPKAPGSYGWSTLAWAKLCPMAIIHTVDIDPRAVRVSKGVLGARLSKGELSRIRFHKEDAVRFLKRFSQEIDILYFDGPGEQGSREGLHAAASKSLQLSSVILFDDCDLPEGKDGRRPVIADALSLGFVTVKDTGRQVLMIRESL